MNQWALLLFTHVIVPELGKWLASRAPGTPPATKDEILTWLRTEGAKYLEAGEAFLREKGAL